MLLNNEQITEEIKKEIKIFIETNENENTTPMDRSAKQKINKETQTSNDAIDQLDLTDIIGHFTPKQWISLFYQAYMEPSPE